MDVQSGALAAGEGQWQPAELLSGVGEARLDISPSRGTGDPMSKTNTGRRDFLLTGAALGAAAAVSPLAMQAAEAQTGYVIPAVDVVSLPVVGSSQRFPVRRIYCVGRNYLE